MVIQYALVPRQIDRRVLQRLVGRGKKWKYGAQGDFIAVDVITLRDGLIADEREHHINGIVTQASTIRKARVTGCRKAFAKAEAGVRRG